MRVNLFFLSLLLGSMARLQAADGIHAYSDESVLANGHFYKIKMKESGVYKLTYEDLSSMGIDPANVRIFGYGGGVLEEDFSLPKTDDLPEIPVWVEKGSDGVFNSGDYILFYGQGTVRWSFDEKQKMFTHKSNSYSEYGYYFVTSDTGTGMRVEDKSVVVPANILPNQVEEFTDYKVYNPELISLLQSGKEFYGETFDEVTSYDFPFYFPHTVRAEDALKVRLKVAASSYSNFSFGFNGLKDKNIGISSVQSPNKGKAATTVSVFTPQSDNLTFNLTYDKPAPHAKGYLNFIELNVRRQLILTGAAMPFHNIDHTGANSYNQYRLDNANERVQVWDITDPLRITRLPVNYGGSSIHFTDEASEQRSYLAIDPTAGAEFQKPELVGAVPNQNLHGIRQADMVIISHPDFLVPAETLAEAHRRKDGMTVAVLSTEQVYNEFSSGTPDATAYRWAIKMLYDRAKRENRPDETPKYLLLFGKGSFDNRGILDDSGWNLVLTYQSDESVTTISNSYTTDDYFTFFEERNLPNSTYKMNVAVGRFPVTTLRQAEDVVAKTIGYMENTDKGLWKSRTAFVADDGDDYLHVGMADNMSKLMLQNAPALHVDKIYMGDYLKEITELGLRVPAMKEKILSTLNSGVFYLNYTGHAFATGWAWEQVMTHEDIDALENMHLPLWVNAACEFSMFDTKFISAGEKILLNTRGGGIGALGAARAVYAFQNQQLNGAFLKKLLNKQSGKRLTVGEAIKEAKNTIGNQLDKLSYIYIGDPAVRLNYADENRILTSAINENTVFGKDTIQSGSTNKIRGYITDEAENTLSDFNGQVYVSIYDKPRTMVTLTTDYYGKSFTYQNRPLLLTETATVVNGVFECTFTLPESYDNEYDKGYIRYYALDKDRNVEAQGYFDNFTVGGDKQETGIDIIGSPDGALTMVSMPNPAREYVTFVVNGSSNVQSCTVEILDVSGRSVSLLTAANQNRIVWNLTDSNGKKVVAGTYFYRARIITTDGQTHTKSNKIIVLN